MVKLNLIIEGGVYTDNVAADTASNVESLRQSLNRLFSKILNREDIEITVFIGASNRNAAKLFAASDGSHSLFVDSDNPAETKHLWFERLKNEKHPERTIVIPEEKKQHVFFMIQEMEAWFLKQPDCLERWAESEGYERKHPTENIREHSTIRNKDIESIAKPSEKLATVMKRFYAKGKKAAKYGKLKTAPKMLDSLDIARLVAADAELQRFIGIIGK